MKSWRNIVCVALLASICGAVSADEPKKGKKAQNAPSATQRLLTDIVVTDAQKEQIAAIDKEFAAKFSELQKQRAAILTADQKKLQQAATKEAKEAGKSAAEIRKAGSEAAKLTDEQAEKTKAVQKMQTELNAKVVVALKKVLTPEQAEKLPKVGGNRAAKPNADGKKKKKPANE